MGLPPLDFSDCYTDSPWFRQSIHQHEEALSRTNNDIKSLVKESKSLLSATIEYGKKLDSFSKKLKSFNFDCIGENMTDREKNLTSSLQEYSIIFEEMSIFCMTNVEETKTHFYEPLEEFRKTQLQGYKDQKKKFDKSSEHYYKMLNNTLALSYKKKDQLLQEHDKELFKAKSIFHSEALNYVFMLQEIQEKKKFEFLEIFTIYMQTFFKCFTQGTRYANDQIDYIKNTQEQLGAAKAESEVAAVATDSLMKRMKSNPEEGEEPKGEVTRSGYLFIMDNRSGVRLTSKWNKFYCIYKKNSNILQTAIPFQSSSSVLNTVKTNSASDFGMDVCVVNSCVARNTDTIEKRFCFDLEVEDLVGAARTLTCQAISEDDRKKWMMAMDGKQPENK